ncbi:component of SufBCD complex [Marinosulfonomonas sp. PRT-SC04]|nr:component of SufBCD complex [Marinosulfonomonas sp. PRT-SC04]
MEWYEIVREVIDLRSFSNLWYWIALAVVWSTTSHWVLGVPFDIALRARRHGGQSQIDLEILVRINTNRLLHISRVSGLWLLGLGSFLLTGLGLLGFYYWIEFAQALFLLAFPLTLVGLLSLSTARLIDEGTPLGEALFQCLRKHRVITQAIGMISIFVTAMFGMYQNLSIGALGH